MSLLAASLTALVMLVAVAACRESAPAQQGLSPVVELPALAPTAAEIIAATIGAPFVTFESSFDSVVDARDVTLTGVLHTDTGQGYAEHSRRSSQLGSGQAEFWLDREQLFVVDDKLRDLRPTPGGAFELIALGSEPPIEPGIVSALASALHSDSDLRVIGIEDDDGGTPLLHLQGTRSGPLEAVVAIDLWVDGANRVTDMTTTSTPANENIQPAVRTLTLRYPDQSPDIPERPELHGSESAGPVPNDRTVPSSAQIAIATAGAPYIEFTTEIELGFPRLRSEGVLDVGANKGFADGFYSETGESFEWLQSSWAEDGKGFATTAGPESVTRPASGVLEDILAELGRDKMQIDSFVVVGVEEIDGQPVLHLIGSRLDVSDNENLLEVWVDAQDRLVRQITTIWQWGDLPVSPAVTTDNYAYPQAAPTIPPRR